MDEVQLHRPVFIVGSGRSGTTLVGSLLGQHPEVLYLNEPRKLWSIDPRTNIWEGNAGEIVLRRADLTTITSERLRRKLVGVLNKSGKPRLVEKTPINAFRIEYLDALCPDARFLHVVRNGRDVASSIARRAAAVRPTRWTPRRKFRDRSGNWFAGVKWQRLQEIAADEGLDAEAVADDLYARGLLEWSLAVTFARRSLGTIEQVRWVELRYEELIARPESTMRMTLDALDLPQSSLVVEEAVRRVRMGPQGAAPTTLTEVGIASELLRELGYLS